MRKLNLTVFALIHMSLKLLLRLTVMHRSHYVAEIEVTILTLCFWCSFDTGIFFRLSMSPKEPTPFLSKYHMNQCTYCRVVRLLVSYFIQATHNLMVADTLIRPCEPLCSGQVSRVFFRHSSMPGCSGQPPSLRRFVEKHFSLTSSRKSLEIFEKKMKMLNVMHHICTKLLTDGR